MKTSTACSCWLLTILFTASSGCSGDAAASVVAPATAPGHGEQAPKASPNKTGPVADAKIDGGRLDLLHIAFQAASALPLDPHEKSRARAQDKVVAACLLLDQPRLALQFTKHITGWMRGSALADCAWYCVQHGDQSEVEQLLTQADQIAAAVTNDPNPQQWRTDTIKLKIARAYTAMGRAAEAAKYATSVDASSGTALDAGWAETIAARADFITAETLDKELAGLDASVAAGTSGVTYATLITCVRLFDKFYADAERRAAIEKRVLADNLGLPAETRIEALVRLVEIALQHDDKKKALELLAVGDTWLAAPTWLPEPVLPWLARCAGLRFRAGDQDAARAAATATLARYQQDREQVLGTSRAETLRPLAEAWHTMGDKTKAAEVYALVLKEGVQNPNSRPRAEDIAETCSSMAVQGFAPDTAMLVRIKEIVSGLGDPW